MYKFEWEDNGAYWKYHGNVSGREIINASKVIYGDPRFDDLKYKLVDFLDVDTINMDENEVTEIACQHRAAEKSNSNIKNAIVARLGSVTELANKFAALFSDSCWEVQVFQDRDKANKWLARKSSF